MAAPRFAPSGDRAGISAPPQEQALSAPALRSPRSWWRLFKPLRRLKLTREGKYYIGVTFGVGFAAINTGNNLLYLLLGMLLSLIIVSGLMSELSLKDLTVLRRLPHRAQVGRPHLVEIEVFNHKKRFPSYAIEVEDLRYAQPADKRCFFLKISPSSAQVAAYRRTPARRGRDLHTGFRIATRFPFGLFEKSRELSAEGELLIYPPVDPLRIPPQARGDHPGEAPALSRGPGEDVLGLRPLRDGDDPRDVYWPKSTMPGQPVLKERARDASHHVELYLDNRPSDELTEAWSALFERRIREVASLAVAHLRRGNSVVVRAASGPVARAAPATGADPVLRYLALIEPSPSSAPPSI